MDKTLHTNCDCGDSAHSMQFTLLEGEDWAELYVEVQLNPRHGLFRRLWYALLYVVGKRSKYSYGHWDEGCISPESAKELRGLIDQFLTLHKKGEP